MGEATATGVDLTKNVLRLRGAATDGTLMFRKKLSRPQFARIMAFDVTKPLSQKDRIHSVQ